MDPKKPRKTAAAKGTKKGTARPAAKGATPAKVAAPAKAARTAAGRAPARKSPAKKVAEPKPRTASARPAAKPAGKAPPARAAAGSAKAGGAKAPRRKLPARPPRMEGLDPDGYFVARVRGEDEARRAPHAMTEGEEREDPMSLRALADVPVPADDEGLGDLPWSYGDDVFVGLPRDPRTLFFYWDHSPETVARAFEWLDRPRAQLRVFALLPDGGWELVRTAEFALESRGFYVHDLEPGRSYRAEIHAVSRDGRDRAIGEPSNEVALPASGPSPVVDDQFATIPWDLPFDSWLRELRGAAGFPLELRAVLARLSAGTKPTRPAWQVRAGEDRPTSPTRAWGGGEGGGAKRRGRKGR